MESRPTSQKSQRHEIGKQKYSLFQTQKLHQRKCQEFLHAGSIQTDRDPIPKPGEFIIMDKSRHAHTSSVKLPFIEPREEHKNIVETPRNRVPPWTSATAADQPTAQLGPEYETIQMEDDKEAETPARNMRRVKSYQAGGQEAFITRSIKEIIASEKDAKVASAARIVTGSPGPEDRGKVFYRRPSASQILHFARVSGFQGTPQKGGRTPTRGTPGSTFRSKRFHQKSLVQTLIHAKMAPPSLPMQPKEKQPSLLKKQKEYKAMGRTESPFMQRNHIEPIRLISTRERERRSPSPDQEREKASGKTKIFLPLEMYDPMITEQNPEQLVKQYANSLGKTYGESKYFDKQAQAWKWEKCEVLCYEKESEHFVISWVNANGSKKVSRLNLRFEQEDQEKFRERLDEAKKHRTEAEMIMKFNFVVDTMDTSIQQMQDIVKERITYLITSYSHFPKPQLLGGTMQRYSSVGQLRQMAMLKTLSSTQGDFKKVLETPSQHASVPRFSYRKVMALLEMSSQDRYNSERACAELRLRKQAIPKVIDLKEIVKQFEGKSFSIKTLRKLFKELERDFQRANHAAIFEATLPFLQEDSPHYQYRSILPEQKFKSYAERTLLPITPDLGVILPEEVKPEYDKGKSRREKFKETLQVINGSLHQGHKDTLRILQKLNVTLEGVKEMNLFQEYYRKWIKIDEFRSINTARSIDVVRELKNAMFDSQYEVNHLVELMFTAIEEKNTVKVQGLRDKSPGKKIRAKHLDLQLPPDFCRRITRFQSLMNSLYERALRDCYETSCKKLLHRFQEMSVEIERTVPFLRAPDAEDNIDTELFKRLILESTWTRKDLRRPVFKSRLVVNYHDNPMVSQNWEGVQHGSISLKPSLQDWATTLSQIICTAKKEIVDIPSISTNEFGNTLFRNSGKIQLFEEYGGEDFFTPSLLEALQFEFELVSKPINACLKLLNKHSGVLCVQPKYFKRALLKQCQSFSAKCSKDAGSSSYNAAHADILQFLQKQLQSLVAAKEAIEGLLPRQRSSALKERNLDGSIKLPESPDAGYLIVSCYGISSQHLRESSLKLLKELEDIVFEYVVRLMEEDNQEIERKVQQSITRIKKEPNNIEELVDLKEYNDSIRMHTNPIIEAITAAMDKMNLLQRFQYRLSEEKFNRTWFSFSRPLDIYMEVGECLEKLKLQKNVFEDELKGLRLAVDEEIGKLKGEVEEVKKVRFLSDYEDTNEKSTGLWERLNNAIECSQIINRREKLFEKLEETNYEELYKLRENFKPFLILWNLCHDYYDKKPLWTDGNLIEINRDTLTEEVGSALEQLDVLLSDHFSSQPLPQTVTLELQHLLEEFKPYIPIIYDLRNPALRPHHWEQLKTHTKIDQLKSELNVSLTELLQQQIMEHKDIINEVSEFATKEQLLLSIVQRMKDEWKQIKFELKEFRETMTCILVNVEPIWELLDQHIVKTMQILQQPYAVNIEGEVAGWKGQLVKVQEALEEWTQAQRYWLNLQPVFESGELRERLPKESQHFEQQNKVWNMYMFQAKSNPNVIDMCYSTKVGESMAGANEKFKMIMKELNEYLDSKRTTFPRFYFLSNEELLGVLAQAKDPMSLQLYVQKCFEGIEQLDFEERVFERQIEKIVEPDPLAEEKVQTFNSEDSEGKIEIITIRMPYWVACGMMSGKGHEYIEFLQHVYPFDRKEIEAKIVARNPEIWLKQVETQMIQALRSQLRDAILNYPERAQLEGSSSLLAQPQRAGQRIVLKDVKSGKGPVISHKMNSEESMLNISEGSDDRDWFSRFPSQITQLSQQISFTQKVESILTSSNQKSLKTLQDQEQHWLSFLCRSITDPSSAEQTRHKLSTMYILQLYNRDVINELLGHLVSSVDDFEWQAQIKYKYELAQKEEKQGRRKLILEEQKLDKSELKHQRIVLLKKDNLKFELLLTSRNYGFQYLGQAGRLILTPLTLRSYRTMCTALTLSLGGAAEGPAGSGKTETTKDFARAAGKKIVVFNCSESLEVSTLSKMLKGLTCCGAFACFDQFNRIEAEVLSVVAQHIATIQQAIQAEVTTYSSPDDGQQIKIDHSCAIFMTLNPYNIGVTDPSGSLAKPLPENLRSFFRPIAMVRANVQIIVQAFLASSGFQSAYFLSKKMVNALQFAQNELTRQNHYDFGMRTIKAVIHTAIKLQDESFTTESFSNPPFSEADSSRSIEPPVNFESRESSILCRALRQVNFPRFIPSDAQKFEQILEALFPQNFPKDNDNRALQGALESIAPLIRMKLTPNFIQKIFQLHDTMKSRHGLMVVGRPMTGKSAIIHSLSRALGWDPSMVEYLRYDESASFVGMSNTNDPRALPSTPFESKQNLQGNRSEIQEVTHYQSNISMPHAPKVNVVHSTTLRSMNTMSLPTPGDVSVVEEAPRATSMSRSQAQTNNKVIVRAINPKSLSIGMLFGQYEKLTNQWTEGVFGKLVKECIQDVQRNFMRQYWIVLDGPVDPVWVENLNTLLDDNKKLCLANGEIIPVPHQMSVLFEVQSLQEASPATISRCGMVFMPSNSLRWHTLLDPWIDSLPPSFRSEYKRMLYHQFVDLIVEPLMSDLFPEEHLSAECDDEEKENRHQDQKQRTQSGGSKSMNFALPVLPAWLMQNLLKLYESFLMGKKRKEQILQEEQEERDRQERREKFEKMTKQKTSPRKNSGDKDSASERKSISFSETDRLKMAKRYTVQHPQGIGGLSRKKTKKEYVRQSSVANKDHSGDISSERVLSAKEVSNLFNQFILAVVWSIGCTLEVSSRHKFNHKLKQLLINDIPKKSSFYHKFNKQHKGYESVTVYFNSAYDSRMQNWFPWAEALAPQTTKRGEEHTVISSSILGLVRSKAHRKFDVFVPTVDSTRYSHLILHMMLHSHPVMLAGKSGTAKTSTLTQCLITLASDVIKADTRKSNNSLSHPQLQNFHIDVLKIILNATTSAEQLQNAISEKLEKKRKGEWGPLPGFYKLVVFFDDLHAPEKQRYGSQPPLELIRSWLDYRGWYQERNAQFSRIEGLKMVAAFTTDIIVSDPYRTDSSSNDVVNDSRAQPSTHNSQSQLSLRFARHFNVLFLPPLEKISLERIFSTMLDRNLGQRKLTFEFKQTHIWRIIRLTVELFNQVSHQFVPTPSRPHYLFNMRDISRIVEGMLQISSFEFRRIGELKQEQEKLSPGNRGQTGEYLSASSEQINKADSNSEIEILKEPSGTFKDDLEKMKHPKDSSREVAIRRLLRFFYRLWLHQSTRVLGDRLATQQEQELFRRIAHGVISDVPYLDYGSISLSEIMFANFTKRGSEQQYTELLGDDNPEGLGGLIVSPIEPARKQLEKCLEEYNKKEGRSSIDIVLFDYAVQHIARISRIIQKPGGHGLLIGTGGTGRRIITRLASFINGCEFQQIHRVKEYSRSDWEEDLKSVMRKSGVWQKQCVFFLQDKLLLQEGELRNTNQRKASFLEDINSLLTSSQVTNLLSKQEKEDIIVEMRRSRPQLRKCPNPMELYTDQVNQNLRIVISVNPERGLFGRPMRQFPALLTATTINWMAELPLSALHDVSDAFFAEVEVEISNQQKQLQQQKRAGKPFEILKELEAKIEDNEMLREHKREISELTVGFHAKSVEQATKAKRENGRRIYVTLPNYMMLLQKVKQLHSRFKCEKIREIGKYRAGVEKLDEANLNVGIMKQEQIKLQPELEAKNKELEITLQALGEKTREQQFVMDQIMEEEKEVTSRKEISEKIKDDCQLRLQKALPELHAAIAALKTINTQDFITMRSYNRPPQLIQLTLETVCILLGVKPEITERLVRGKRVKTHQYWDKAKRLLKDYKKLIDRLQNYDKNNIPEDRIRKLQNYLQNPNFAPHLIKNASQAAEGLCKWVLAIVEYDIIAKEIQPKREALKLATERYDEVKAQLNIKQEELAQVDAKLQLLKEQFEGQNKEKNELQSTLNNCFKKQERALKLLNGLSSEKSRWSSTADIMEGQLKHALGDALLSATYMSYLGPFPQNHRAQIKYAWMHLLENTVEEKGFTITKSEKFCSTKTLTDPLQIANWVLKGLPNQIQSIENIAFMQHSHKFPLLIDPQGQACRYIKQADPKLHVMKLTGDYNFLEKAIINGWTVLIEDSYPEQDPALEMLLTQDLEIKGGVRRSPSRVNIVILPSSESKLITPRKEDSNQKNEEQEEEKKEEQKEPTEGEQGSNQVEIPRLPNQLSQRPQQIFQTLQGSVTQESILDSPHTEWGQEEEPCKVLKLNEQELDWNPDFRLYMTCTAPNPHISTHFFSNMFVLNFSITPSAIREQLLSRVAWIERQRDQEERLRILEQTTAFKQRKKDIEHQILSQLQRVGGAILEDDALVNSLNCSKEVSEDLDSKLRAAKVVEDKLENSRTELNPVASQATVFYFLLQDIGCWSPAYRYSHEWFIENYYTKALNCAGDAHKRASNSAVSAVSQQSVNQAEQDKRNGYLQRHLRKTLFQIMSMGLYRQHQKSFTLALALKLRAHQGLLDQQLLKFILSGISKDSHLPLKNLSRPKVKYITQGMWENLMKLEQLANTIIPVTNLRKSIIDNLQKWENFITSSEREPLPPQPFNIADSVVQIALSKILRPEDVKRYTNKLIQETLGDYYLNDPIQGLKEAAQTSHADIPVLVLLPEHSGDDPYLEISKTAEELNRKVHSMSLGRDSSKPAVQMLEVAFRSGRWLVLQNCHLAGDVLDQVFAKFQKLKQPNQDSNLPRSQLSYDFRLWLTVRPIEGCLSERIYMQCMKVSNDPPDSVNGVLTKIYSGIKSSKKQARSFESNQKIQEWRKLFMGLSFVHAITRLRKKYGTLGWSGFSSESYSHLYDFNDDDFNCAKSILYLMLNLEAKLQECPLPQTKESTTKVISMPIKSHKLSAPLNALRYITGRCIYGSRMWEETDQEVLYSIFRQFYDEQVLEKTDYFFAGEEHEHYKILTTPYVYEVMAYLKAEMPKASDSPCIVGLNQNAESLANVKIGNCMLHDLLQLTTYGGTGKSSFESVTQDDEDELNEADSKAAVLLETLELVKKNLPETLGYPYIKRRLTQRANMDSLGVVCLAEVARYNQLIRKVRQMIEDTEDVTKGKYGGSLETSSDKIESVEEGLAMYEVPVVWRKISYPTRKPIMSWLKGLQKRMDFFERWGMEATTPLIIELPAFFHPQSLLTRIRQLYAKKQAVSYDMVQIVPAILKVHSPVMALSAQKRKTFTVRLSSKKMFPRFSGRKSLAANYLTSIRRQQALREEDPDDSSYDQEDTSRQKLSQVVEVSKMNEAEESVQEEATPLQQIMYEQKEDCFLVNGIFLEGAGWNVEQGHLQEANPKDLKLEMPVFRLQPTLITEIQGHRSAKTESPDHKRSSGIKVKKNQFLSDLTVRLYSTRERAVRDEQALTFDPKVSRIKAQIMNIRVKCNGLRDKWLQRGVAFIAEYDF